MKPNPWRQANRSKLGHDGAGESDQASPPSRSTTQRNFPEVSETRSCCQRVIVPSCELSTHEKPLPDWATTRPARGFAMTFTQGRGVRGSVTTYSVPSGVKCP